MSNRRSVNDQTNVLTRTNKRHPGKTGRKRESWIRKQ